MGIQIRRQTGAVERPESLAFGEPAVSKNGTLYVGNSSGVPVRCSSRVYSAQLLAAGWTQEADGSYTQTVACSGMTAAVQIWDVRAQPGATVADNLAIAEALGCITVVESLEGQVKVICGDSQPAADFTAVFLEV